jgi:hypothetical protein
MLEHELKVTTCTSTTAVSMVAIMAMHAEHWRPVLCVQHVKLSTPPDCGQINPIGCNNKETRAVPGCLF